MKCAAYRMPAGQGPGYRVVCSICRKTQMGVGKKEPAAATIGSSDGIVDYGPLSLETALAISHAHNLELHPVLRQAVRSRTPSGALIGAS